ncbi:MAG: hypothetical protein JXR68_03815 [Bacteroidales bacterium]|nr:hypothetical protein [Bacteroidales bacterium]
MNDNQIVADITFSANYVDPKILDVNVYTDNNGTLILYQSFTLLGINFPILTNITPNTSNKLETLSVTLSGQNTHFTQATGTTLWLSQGSKTVIYPNTINTITETEIEAEFSFPYYLQAGNYDVNTFTLFDNLH